MLNVGMMTSDSSEWATPQDLFDRLDAVHGFDLDVCATAENAKCKTFFTKEQNGLTYSWYAHGKTAWMNPPYGRNVGEWCEKAKKEAWHGLTTVALLPARTDTAWFHDHVAGHADITFIRGRLKFGGCKNSAPFPSMIAIFRPRSRLQGWNAGGCNADVQ